MLVTGRFISAAEALSYGLVSRVAPDAGLDEAVTALTAAIGSKSPVAVRIGKAMFGRQRAMSLEDAYAYAGKVMAGNMMAADVAEGIDAFIAKRKPVWTGR
jgi:enoyl-CoA hydratase/carnithine racemase